VSLIVILIGIKPTATPTVNRVSFWVSSRRKPISITISIRFQSLVNWCTQFESYFLALITDRYTESDAHSDSDIHTDYGHNYYLNLLYFYFIINISFYI